LVLLFAVSFVFSVISQFFAPAEAAVIPEIVGRQRLMQANSFFHLTFTGSQLIGLVFVGPLIVKVVGVTTFFLSMAALYLISGILVWRLPKQAREGVPAARPDFRRLSQLGEVVELLRSDREMLAAMGYLTLGSTLTLVVAMLAPGYVVEVLGVAAADAVFVLAPAGVGMLSAAFIFSRRAGLIADRRAIIRRGLIVVSFALFAAAALPALGQITGLVRPEWLNVHVLSEWDIALVAAVMLTTLVAGFGFAAIVVAAQTLLQERAPARARGRVFAVQFMLANLLSIIPLLFVGGLADLIGIQEVLMLIAVALMGVALLSRRQPSDTRLSPA
jgi:MFS family permease